MSYEKELADLEKKFSNDQQALRQKYAVLQHLPVNDYHPPFVHYGPLYSSRGSVRWAGTQYDSLREGKQPDQALLAALLAQFPPVPLVLVNDGCKSFRPAAVEWKGEVSPIFPVTLDLDFQPGWEVLVRWYGPISGDLWRFEVRYPIGDCPAIGYPVLHFTRHPDGDIARVTQCDYQPKDLPGARRIKWNSGGVKIPNRFTVYWPDPEAAVDVAALVRDPANAATAA
jgi:hypothetical protein